MAEQLTYLQTVTIEEARANPIDVAEAAEDISFYNPPSDIQKLRHQAINRSISETIALLVQNTPPGPERSKAIAAMREARMWANAGIALAQDHELSPAVATRPDPVVEPADDPGADRDSA